MTIYKRLTPQQAARMSTAEQYEWFEKAIARRPPVRAGLVGGGPPGAGRRGLGTAALLATADRPAGVEVVPFGRHIAFGADPSTSMSVTWQVPALVAEPFVRVGSSPLDLGERIPAELSVLCTPVGAASPAEAVALPTPKALEQYYIQARIEHLLPGRTYYYALGHQGYDPANGPVRESVRSFRTAPAGRASFRFTAFGDQGVADEAAATDSLVRSQNPAFHLYAGDLSYANSTGDGLITNTYDPRVWDAFLARNEPLASTIPWQAVVGNHEMEAWYSHHGYGGYFKRFAQPTAGVAFYSFVFANVAFIALDANDVNHEYAANRGYSGGAQTAWLERRLDAYRADAGIDFIVAYFHQCAYCTGEVHASDGGVREAWTPLFDRYSVDLVINGHNHVYERTDPLKAGSPTTMAPIGSTVCSATQGTTYVVAGSPSENRHELPVAKGRGRDGEVDGDAPYASYESWYHDSSGGRTSETVDYSRVRSAGFALLVVESVPGDSGADAQLVLRALDERGAEVDLLTIRREA